MNKTIQVRRKWTKELVLIEALKYNTRSEFQKKSPNVYAAALRNQWLNEVTNHMVILRKDEWTFDEIKKIAEKYDKLIDFQKKENAAYLFAKRHFCLDDFTSHMKKNIRWSKDMLIKEALKYSSRTEFEKKNTKAYNTALRRKIMDEITTHMKPIGNRYKRLIYVYEFSDNHFYVGLTYNIKKRHSGHMSSDRSCVFKHMKMTGIEPVFKIIDDYVSIEVAQQKENEVLKKYINNGWITINKAKTGGLGSSNRKWTKEMVIDVVKKYKTLKDFRENEPGAIGAALKNKWYEEVTSHLERIIKVRKYTKEILKKIISKYETLSDFRNKESSAYSSIRRNNWLYMLNDLKRRDLPWTDFRNVEMEAKKYKTKKEFEQNSTSAYTSARKNGWLNEVTKHMTPRFIWTKNSVDNAAKKYNSISEFVKNDSLAYEAACKHGWLNDLTSHMKKRKSWDSESVKKEASKYENRFAFQVGSPGAYLFAKKNNILNDITSHMTFKNVKGHKKDVFICEHCNKKIGGIGNLKKHLKISHNIEFDIKKRS